MLSRNFFGIKRGRGGKGLTSWMQITTHRRGEGQGRRLKKGGLPRMKVA